MGRTEPEPEVAAPDATGTPRLPARGTTDPHDIHPTEPPGRSNRKARRYSEQIRCLAAEGYSLALIRDALATVGVVVSKSTVQREASRPHTKVLRRPSPTPVSGVLVSTATPPLTTDGPRRVLEPVPSPVRGKDVAEAFMKGRLSNPLLRKNEP